MQQKSGSAIIALSVIATVIAGSTAAQASTSTAPSMTSTSAVLATEPENGSVVRRSTMAKNLTAADRASIRELGFGEFNAGAIVIRKITKNHGQQIERLRNLAGAPGGFQSAGLCDAIVAQGDGHALCTARVSGPLGSVPVRLPFATQLGNGERGGQRFVLRNERALEAKSIFSWTEIIKPNGLKVAVDIVPQDDGWLVYTRVGLALSKHEGEADKLCGQLLKLDSWLAHELALS